FFMATVPAGTHLYHGTSKSEPVEGMEWLAFEPEHALIFARPRGEPPGGPPGEGDGDEDEEKGERIKHASGHGEEIVAHQLPLNPSSAPLTGYLHTYAPPSPLHLLYIDGLSAGKTLNGTLDTQDLLLLNLTTSPGSPMGGEYARARGLCRLAETLWEGKIDGVLRMEGGFEVILCKFEGRVERVDVMPVRASEGPGVRGRPGRGGKGGPRSTMGGWLYIQAITSRYHGIGGGRVKLDYSHFVSAFAYERLDLWTNDVVSDTPHPRLTNASPAQLDEIKGAVTDMILQSSHRREEGEGEGEEEKTNWQEVADMVVTRYSSPLHYLHTNQKVRSNKETFAHYLTTLLHPFVAPSARNITHELLRCTSQVVPPLPLPPSPLPLLAHTTIHTVASQICSTLLSALDTTTSSLSRSLAPASPPPSHALELVDSLVAYLRWTTWKECGPCGDEEVCFVPIWPMGSVEEHRAPRCTREEGVGAGYWG
ncbi:hypothetical protein K458DRAFT_260536, partial [Lentithecium fluviatile CBS 122367]